jgi:tetratricopeptide (TPR) repeat protein
MEGAENSWKDLLAVARAADPDEVRNQLRRALETTPVDRVALEQLASSDRLENLSSPTLVLLGRYLNAIGKAEKAVIMLRQAQRRFPNDFWINHALAWSYCHMPSPHLQEALPFWTAARALRPDSPGVCVNRGIVHAELGQHDEALADCAKAIELKPDLAEAWCHRGNIYFKMNQLARAIDDYSQAIKCKPDFAVAWHNRGVSHLRQDQDDKALFHFTRATELKPDYLEAWNGRGMAHHYLKQCDMAVVAYSRAIKLRPDYAEAWMGRGMVYRQLEQLQDALKDYQQYRKLTRDSPRALNQLAWFLANCPDARLRDTNQAVELAKKAVVLLPKEWSYWNTLGVAQYRAGDYNAAVVALEKSVQLGEGGTGSDWFVLAMSHWKLDMNDRARKAYDRAVRWMKQHASQDEELRRFRAEAAELLGINLDQ